MPGASRTLGALGVAAVPGTSVVAESAKSRAPRPPPSSWDSGNETVAVVVCGAVTGGAARTPKSLTGASRSSGTFACSGESTHAKTRPFGSQSAGSPAWPSSLSWRKPTAMRHRTGPVNGDPSARVGSVNSGWSATVGSPLAGANVLGVDT